MPAIRAMVVDVAREVAREVVAQHKPMAVTVHVPAPPAPPTAADISEAVRATVYDVLGGPEQKNGEPTAPLSVEALDAAPAAIQVKRPRVDVVGLTGKNAEVVRQRCGSMFDLRFLDPDEARSRDVSAPQTIVCKKFVPHAAIYRMAANTNTDIVMVEGAGHSVVKKLHSMVAAMRQ